MSQNSAVPINKTASIDKLIDHPKSEILSSFQFVDSASIAFASVPR
ncbi:hypothetical protein LEP1GSC060_2326 [Leptospira weilii serovar Ranarum str. ICFT]|uniref:Uncharacterized protein n=1 Tax=Leptospira weilii serovar Ranarum str. ICFT TaxID=1218598 RepID=N1WQ41_9LEPT|nr:hypothetical protein LEP1GSC060_2326 [Leptospira weilii serovar Ranarum str. ICFT]